MTIEQLTELVKIHLEYEETIIKRWNFTNPSERYHRGKADMCKELLLAIQSEHYEKPIAMQMITDQWKGDIAENEKRKDDSKNV